MALLTVRCPGCGNDQKYQPHGGLLSEKSKRCVYCGKTFKVHSCLPRSRVVEADHKPLDTGFATAPLPRRENI